MVRRGGQRAAQNNVQSSAIITEAAENEKLPPIFQQVCPPVLENLIREDVNAFLQEYDNYEKECKSANNAHQRALKYCIDSYLLEDLCEEALSDANVDPTTVTDDQLRQCLYEIVTDNQQIPTMETIMQGVRFGERGSISERCHSLFLSVRRRLGVLHLTEVFQHSDRQALIIKSLTSVIEPKVLQENVQHEVTMNKHLYASNISSYRRMVLSLARQCERFVPLPEAKGNLAQQPSTAHPPLPECLNPRCSQRHLIKDCKITSAADKTRLVQEYRARRQAAQPTPNAAAITATPTVAAVTAQPAPLPPAPTSTPPSQPPDRHATVRAVSALAARLADEIPLEDLLLTDEPPDPSIAA